ncbi:hypothetical protein [Winogradskyella helgolandensis]|uniref:hypothetical protein n=1 Tax=Winogradskyella helgolandensis TaxID=2697010 RepID=UPI0015BA8270|nr:hypothetical protein [Winogradskyella helgolandensis]
MEKYIDLINAYLNKTLSESEVLEFENRLNTDFEFNTIYNEHLIFLKGIERIQIKEEIREAKSSFFRFKWLKSVGSIIGVLILAVLVWLLFFNNHIPKDELRGVLNSETEFVQHFEVSSDSIITIEGEEGTRLTINPKDLEFPSKQPLKGEVLTIQLIELTNKQDLLIANTQTISNDEWLISGGAYKIDIKANNQTLVLKEGKTIEAKFPKNTQEENMQVFYGDRNKNGYLNWNLSNVQLQNEKHFTIFCKDSIVLDVEMTSRFGGVETMMHLLEIDTLGFLTQDELNSRFPQIESFSNQVDTIIVLQEYIYSETIDSFAELSALSIDDYKTLINQRYLTKADSLQLKKNYEKRDLFYKAIEISKLGWINIDQYYKMEDRITITFENNKDVNFNTFTEEAYSENSKWHETYLIDNENNTILNVYSKAIEIPRGKPFTIISFCVVEDIFYVSRKTINFNEGETVILNYKKRNKSQIKSLLRL